MFIFIDKVMIPLILFLPLISIFQILWRFIYIRDTLSFKNITLNEIIVKSLSPIFLSCIISWYGFFRISILGNYYYVKLLPWFDKLDMMEIYWGLQFDSLSISMCILVTTVSSLVHLYSTSYMEADPHLPRFLIYLSLFTFFMLILVTADNFLQLFVGWEGVGLCSYLLINFWFTRIAANKSAMKAILINRIGDLGLTLGILILYSLFRSLDFNVIFPLVPYYTTVSIYILNVNYNILTVIDLLLFVGVVGKSAQIGLHTWLPDAMEGPTPVSALIHAATMVTAGIFLIIRCSYLFEYSEVVLLIITIFGGLTAFFAASIGLIQNDLKKVIAYSTCSQLGYMAFACGLSQYTASFFHLINHGFFKALLFLSAGVVIHSMSDEQDMRKMGGLISLLPLTYSFTLIGSLSLMGFPFLTGFYSKDLILELAYASYSNKGLFVFWLGSISAFLTAFYSIRSIFLVFIMNTSLSKKSFFLKNHDVNIIMGLPLMILSFGSIFCGYLLKEMMVGLGTDFWGNSIFISFTHSITDVEFIPILIKNLPVILSLLGGLVSLILNSSYNSLLVTFTDSSKGRLVYSFLSKKWCVDEIYNRILQLLLTYGFSVTFLNFDRGFYEFFGPRGPILSLLQVTNFKK